MRRSPAVRLPIDPLPGSAWSSDGTFVSVLVSRLGGLAGAAALRSAARRAASARRSLVGRLLRRLRLGPLGRPLLGGRGLLLGGGTWLVRRRRSRVLRASSAAARSGSLDGGEVAMATAPSRCGPVRRGLTRGRGRRCRPSDSLGAIGRHDRAGRIVEVEAHHLIAVAVPVAEPHRPATVGELPGGPAVGELLRRHRHARGRRGSAGSTRRSGAPRARAAPAAAQLLCTAAITWARSANTGGAKRSTQLGLHAGGLGDVGDRPALPQARLDLPDRQRALDPRRPGGLGLLDALGLGLEPAWPAAPRRPRRAPRRRRGGSCPSARHDER